MFSLLFAIIPCYHCKDLCHEGDLCKCFFFVVVFLGWTEELKGARFKTTLRCWVCLQSCQIICVYRRQQHSTDVFLPSVLALSNSYRCSKRCHQCQTTSVGAFGKTHFFQTRRLKRKMQFEQRFMANDWKEVCRVCRFGPDRWFCPVYNSVDSFFSTAGIRALRSGRE